MFPKVFAALVLIRENSFAFSCELCMAILNVSKFEYIVLFISLEVANAKSVKLFTDLA